MKKLFVSVPMKGRTEEEIKASIQKMKKIAEIYEGEELELIDSYIEDNPPKDSKEYRFSCNIPLRGTKDIHTSSYRPLVGHHSIYILV